MCDEQFLYNMMVERDGIHKLGWGRMVIIYYIGVRLFAGGAFTAAPEYGPGRYGSGATPSGD